MRHILLFGFLKGLSERFSFSMKFHVQKTRVRGNNRKFGIPEVVIPREKKNPGDFIFKNRKFRVKYQKKYRFKSPQREENIFVFKIFSIRCCQKCYSGFHAIFEHLDASLQDFEIYGKNDFGDFWNLVFGFFWHFSILCDPEIFFT